MVAKYQVPLKNRIARPFERLFIRSLFHILGKVRVTGAENVPKQGAYLIAMNHVSLVDAPLVVSFWPKIPEAAGAAEIWNKPFQSTLARLYGGIKVHRGQYDRQLLDTIVNVLNSGYPLVLAPEGGRSHELGMRRANPGIAYIQALTGVPIVPTGAVGATDDFLSKGLKLKRPLIELRIGPPFQLPPLEGKGAAMREARQRNADLVMLHIGALLPPEYWGVYAAEMADFNPGGSHP